MDILSGNEIELFEWRIGKKTLPAGEHAIGVRKNIARQIPRLFQESGTWELRDPGIWSATIRQLKNPGIGSAEGTRTVWAEGFREGHYCFSLAPSGAWEQGNWM